MTRESFANYVGAIACFSMMVVGIFFPEHNTGPIGWTLAGLAFLDRL